MQNVTLPLLLFVCSTALSAQQSEQLDFKKPIPPQAMCTAAAKLREAGTNEVVLTMVIDARGRVESFTTDSPKGLRLEKMKEAATAIKALRCEPARKDGQAVKVMIRVKFDCSGPATDASKEQQPR